MYVKLLFCCMLPPRLFNRARSFLVQLPSSYFSARLVSVVVVHPYRSIDRTATWEKLRFIISDRSDFHMTDSQLIAVRTFSSHVLMSFSVDQSLLPGDVSLSASFRDLSNSMVLSPLWWKHMNSVLSTLIWRPMQPAARSRLCSRDSAWVGICQK